MHIHGVDFTSRPSRRKPVTVASAEHNQIVSLECFPNLDKFEDWLNTSTGVIGIDAPFGYPVALCSELFLSERWEDIAKELSVFGSTDRLYPLAARVEAFRNVRPSGDKEPKRLTDRASNSASAMKFFQPPVGRMAARLLPILHRTSHNVLPVRPTSSPVTVVEIYPAKWVRANSNGITYKDQLGLRESRRLLLSKTRFSMTSQLEEEVFADEKGDLLDAIIACEQVATWIESGGQMPNNPQILLEGWII